MFCWKWLCCLVSVAVTAVFVSSGYAGIDYPTAEVGWAGNENDAGGFGAVGYDFRIGSYEVSAGQYVDFLNAVAADDPHGLYNPTMWSSDSGCKIERSGSSGSYLYSVATDWAARPVNFVSWGDVARFANWMHNGQPQGQQNALTTEDGSYTLNGAVTVGDLLPIERNPGATWVIPTEDEWYKAAYHGNDGRTGNYYLYPTSTDEIPSNDLLIPDPGNHATFYTNPGDYTLGAPYYRTEVGVHASSESPYGAFDMGGNLAEWNEAVVDSFYRGVRGGSYNNFHGRMAASYRDMLSPTDEYINVGFRLALLPQTNPGDADGDGDVDLTDLSILAANWGASNPPTQPLGFAQGNFNGDGVVDLSDLALLAGNWGFGVAVTVPEPASASLVGMLGVGLMRRRRA